MLAKTELEFLKSPGHFSKGYARVLRYRIKAKSAQLRSELSLLDMTRLNVTENCNGVTDFITVNRIKKAQNRLTFKKQAEIGAFGGIWTRDHYLTKVTPHRARLRRHFLFLLERNMRYEIKSLRLLCYVATAKNFKSIIIL